MDKDDKTNFKRKYYTIDFCESKLLKQIFFPDEDLYREVSLLSKNNIKFRGMTFSSSYYLWKTYFNGNYQFGAINNECNVYISKARVKRFPLFPMQPNERRDATNKFFKDKYESYIKYYDIYLDFDIDNPLEIPTMLNEVYVVIKDLLKYDITFELVFSGTRGFKLLIYNKHYQMHSVSEIVKLMQQHYNFKTLDRTCIYQVPSKLMKLNFTLVNDNEHLNIALPLKLSNYNFYFQKIEKMKNFKMFDCNNVETYTNARDNLYTGTFNNFVNPDVTQKLNLIKYTKEVLR